MPEIIKKEVRYDEYCYKCLYKNTDEAESPCNECLAQGWNEYSHKPIKFKEDE